ncbi:MAG: hypothetical protein AB7G68_17335 [Nitrospiraceae bacterium]|jgi:hypothetical protein
MTVKGFLLQNGSDREFLLTIQPSAQGPFERLVVREKVDGYWIDLGSNAQTSWQDRSLAIAAVFGYLQGLWQTTQRIPKVEQ